MQTRYLEGYRLLYNYLLFLEYCDKLGIESILINAFFGGYNEMFDVPDSTSFTREEHKPLDKRKVPHISIINILHSYLKFEYNIIVPPNEKFNYHFGSSIHMVMNRPIAQILFDIYVMLCIVHFYILTFNRMYQRYVNLQTENHYSKMDAGSVSEKIKEIVEKEYVASLRSTFTFGYLPAVSTFAEFTEEQFRRLVFHIIVELGMYPDDFIEYAMELLPVISYEVV